MKEKNLIITLTKLKAQQDEKKTERLRKKLHSQSKRYGADKSLVLFVKECLIENGGNYVDICNKLEQMLKFVEFAKNNDIKVEFYQLITAFKEFFKGDKTIVDVKFYEMNSGAIYTKEVENYSIWSTKNYKTHKKYGMFVAHHEETGLPIIYFGHRQSRAEFKRGDTYLYFMGDRVKYFNDYSAHYDEHILWGDGTEAEFMFDNLNRLVEVQCRGKVMNGLFWDDKVTTITFDNDDFEAEYQKMLKEKRLISNGQTKD